MIFFFNQNLILSLSDNVSKPTKRSIFPLDSLSLILSLSKAILPGPYLSNSKRNAFFLVKRNSKLFGCEAPNHSKLWGF